MGIPWKKIGIGVGVAAGGLVAGGAGLKIASMVKGPATAVKPQPGQSLASMTKAAVTKIGGRAPARRRKRGKSLVITAKTMETINLLNRLARSHAGGTKRKGGGGGMPWHKKKRKSSFFR